ncbi:hypothetical protein FEE95_04390 [Maribacter algarum]|uniref:Uncharacterized protein n=1 Tax=Maribacter algarum (ex Zhang et al. 2020) TaxID=2578118 RepID=A0A5S3QLC9_9FLAO|nr:hypothetical protein [Maribacter algarum]TMM58674.1 hypothetical protein FEE95_04390 [Maribacter algarum]
MKACSCFVMICLFLGLSSANAQKSVDIDGRLQSILNEFFEECKKYNIDYHEKLFQLNNIDITSSLPLEEGNTVLGMVTRDAEGNVENILINWAAMLDPEMLKVVAFHEFAHHFLDYKHTCQDCNEIMAVTNTSYYDLARDWENQVENLFTTSPVYLAKETKEPVAAVSLQ